MKPAAFEYRAPTTPEDAVAALAERAGDAHVLAGGQSLVADMNHRRVRPARLVDINGIRDLERLEPAGAALRVGALVRHQRFEEPVAPGPLGRLLARASTFIAHPPVRTRGTMAGSLAYAHPASEWCAIALALDAEIELLGPDGGRTVRAADFFRGPFSTARRPDELLTAVRLPLPEPDAGVGFVEQRRTHASFAQLAVVAVLSVRDSVVTGARIALANAADRPLLAHGAQQQLLGRAPDAAAFSDAGAVAARDADPVPEPHAGIAYRRQLVAVLVEQALQHALADRSAERADA